MLSRRDEDLLAADVEPHAVGLILDVKWFRFAVAGDRYHGEGKFNVEEPILFVAGGEITIDAAFDLSTGGCDLDRLGDRKRSILLHFDITVVVVDPLGLCPYLMRQQKKSGGEKRSNAPDSFCGTHPIVGHRFRHAVPPVPWL